ncbi:tetratricopeptide repeat protein [Nocardia sp. CA-128927]|uniref:tetratricopeptide repeat protein n=1 Tax=Nocardia sp. CA-128927 TaxID=3239975 RepID=UPI003D99DD7E
MDDQALDVQLDMFIEYFRRLLDGKSMVGLEVWATKFSQLRQNGEFELCRKLAHALRTRIDAQEHETGVARYAEGWLLDRIGKKQSAIEAYEASLKAFQQAGIPLDSIVQCQIGALYQEQGEWQKADEKYHEAIESARDDHDRALVLNNLGNLALQNNDSAAEQHFRDARELLRDNDTRNYAAATHGLAAALLSRNEPQQSQDMHLECYRLFQELGDASGSAAAIGGIGMAQLSAGHPRVAIHNFERVLQMDGDSALDPHIGVQTLTNLAVAHQELGEYDAALGYLSIAIAGYADLGDWRSYIAALVNLARLHNLCGDQAATEQTTAKAMRAAEKYGFPEDLRRLPS